MAVSMAVYHDEEGPATPPDRFFSFFFPLLKLQIEHVHIPAWQRVYSRDGDGERDATRDQAGGQNT